MIYILDACAMIAFLRKELGSIVVEEILLDKNNKCFAHAINLCEVFYDFHRLSGEQAAEKAIGDLKAAGIIERNDPNFLERSRAHKISKQSIFS